MYRHCLPVTMDAEKPEQNNTDERVDADGYSETTAGKL